MDVLKTKEVIMLKKIWSVIGRNKFTLIGILIVSLFSLFNFVWLVITGDFLNVQENKDFLFALFIFRCVMYLTLFALVEKYLKGKVKSFLGKLLAFTVLFYEVVVVFNIPALIFERLGA